MKERQRESNFELFRICAMCMIILIHLISAVDLSYFGLEGNFRGNMGACIVGICNVGASCFVLISGYFGIRFSIKKLIKFEMMMITCSVIETIILVVIFPDDMRGIALIEQMVKTVIPFISRKYWFYSCYICVFLFSGFIQKFIDNISKKDLECFIVLLMILFSVLPTLFYFEIMQDAGKGLVQMIMLYIIGRYIRVYRDISICRFKSVMLLLALWMLNVISITHPLQIGTVIHSLCRDNSITNIVMAIILLYLFKDMSFSCKWINCVSKYIFAVFALENTITNVFAKYIQRGLFLVENDFLSVAIVLGSVLAIFIICIGVGMGRDFVLGKVEICLSDLMLRKIKKVRDWIDKRYLK